MTACASSSRTPLFFWRCSLARRMCACGAWALRTCGCPFSSLFRAPHRRLSMCGGRQQKAPDSSRSSACVGPEFCCFSWWPPVFVVCMRCFRILQPCVSSCNRCHGRQPPAGTSPALHGMHACNAIQYPAVESVAGGCAAAGYRCEAGAAAQWSWCGCGVGVTCVAWVQTARACTSG